MDRLEKINAFLQEEIAQIILKEIDTSQIGIVNINRVEVSPDLKTALVWVSFLENNTETNLKKLQKYSYQIQQFLAPKIRFKFIPKLHFKLDTSGEYANHIETLLKKIKNEKHQL